MIKKNQTGVLISAKNNNDERWMNTMVFTSVKEIH